jgi:heme exporter protein D
MGQIAGTNGWIGMTSLHQFFTMGGYATYVWTAYGLSAITLLLNVWWPITREKRLLRELRERTAVIDKP